MAPRRTSLALVLALLASMAIMSRPMPSTLGEQTEALGGVGISAQLRRSGKRLEAPQRDHNRTSRERPLALPARTFVAPNPDVVAVVESIGAPRLRDHRAEPIARARAPPQAS